MKKLTMIMIIVLFCFSLVACEPIFGHMGTIQENFEISSVELISYDNPDRLVVRHGLIAIFVRPADYAPFERDKCTLIETLSEEKKEEFFERMGPISIINGDYSEYNSPNGICLKITCSDGSFFVFENTDKKETFGAKYSADGGFDWYWGEPDPTSITSLINDFFNYQVAAD